MWISLKLFMWLFLQQPWTPGTGPCMQGSSDSSLHLHKQSSMQWHQQSGSIWSSQLEDRIIWWVSLSSSWGSEEGTGVGGMDESNTVPLTGVGSSTWQGNVWVTFASQISVTSELYLQKSSSLALHPLKYTGIWANWTSQVAFFSVQIKAPRQGESKCV